MIDVRRSGGMLFENNVIFNDFNALGGNNGGVPLRFDPGGGYNWVRSNIFMDASDGCINAGDGYNCNGCRIDYNIGFDCNTGWATGVGSSESDIANCKNLATCDPLFVNASGGNFKVNASSPAIDLGDTTAAVPIGGGLRRDRGRFERNATPDIANPTQTYDDAPKSSMTFTDDTPRICFDNEDFDRRMVAELPIACATPNDPNSPCYDVMTAFELQLDQSKRFSSWDGIMPTFTTGKVVLSPPANSACYVLPSGNRLGAGDWYVRVRTYDTHQPGIPGSWSVPVRLKVLPLPPCQISYCTGPGLRCEYESNYGGCCRYHLVSDETCESVETAPPSACGCP
jgi:hypothetical protein